MACWFSAGGCDCLKLFDSLQRQPRNVGCLHCVAAAATPQCNRIAWTPLPCLPNCCIAFGGSVPGAWAPWHAQAATQQAIHRVKNSRGRAVAARAVAVLVAGPLGRAASHCHCALTWVQIQCRVVRTPQRWGLHYSAPPAHAGGRPFEARGAARTPALCPVVGSPPPIATGRHPATLHHPTLRPALKRVQVGVGGGPLCCGTPACAPGASAGPGVQG